MSQPYEIMRPAPGSMQQRVRDFDWAATPIGPAASWPVELKAIVNFILESRFPAAVVWGPEMTTIYNDAFRPILGDKPEALGRSFRDVWAEAWHEIGPIAEKAYAGEATFIPDFPLMIDRTGHLEQAWFTFCYSPLRLADGRVAGMMDTVFETTASVRNRQDLAVLTHELRHRLKNSLAAVQTLVRQTLKDVADRTPVEALLDRLVALGHAHDVLFQEGWSSATIEDVAHAALSGLMALDRIEVDGPRVPLGARAAVALSLILHELATNAAKYGALSAPEGRVRLAWTVDSESGRLRLTWVERDGPPVEEPSRPGFGSRLIDMGLSPRCRVTREYPATGVQAALEAPLDELLVG